MSKPQMHCLLYTDERSLVPFNELMTTPSSGTAYSIAMVAYALAQSGNQVTICGYFTEASHQDGIHYLPCTSEASLIDIATKSRPDSVVVVGHAIGSLTAAIQQLPRVLYWMHNWTKPALLQQQCQQFGFQQVIGVSPYHLGFYLLHAFRKGPAWSQLSFINNPANCELEVDFVEKDCQQSIKVAFIGYPSQGKGFDKVVEVMHALQQKTSKPCELHIFGDLVLYNKAENELDVDLDSYPNSIKHGSLPRLQLYPKLAECHFAISGLSGSESFCLSLVDAAACGVVPVTLNAGGQLSYLHKGNALIGNSIAAVPDLILACADQPARYALLAEAAKAIPARFQLLSIAEQWQALLWQQRPPQSLWQKVTIMLWFGLGRFRYACAKCLDRSK
jgi:glycosyltransferase involved in cell wall biosynthesis